MRADRIADIDRLLRDATALVTPADREAALSVALDRYSQDRPRVLTVRMTLPAGGVPLADLAEWTAGLSALVAVEYPTYPYAPIALPAGRWTVTDTATGPVAMLDPALPPGIFLGLRYTAPHVVSDGADSLPPGHREAVACYAASHLLEGLAAAHAGDRDPVLGADAATLGDVSRSYAARAKRLRDLYGEGIAAGAGPDAAAGASVTLSLGASDGGRRLFRRR